MLKIVLTGAPCAGKSTLGAWLTDHLRSQNIRTLFLPELATRLYSSGISPLDFLEEKNIILRETMMRLRKIEEGAIFDLAASLHNPDKTVIILDRAIADEAAYCTPGEYQTILIRLGLSNQDIMDRYDAVFHLETVALLGDHSYDRQSNPVRLEDPNLARHGDLPAQLAWSDHPNFSVIKAQPNIADKRSHLYSAVCSTVAKSRPDLAGLLLPADSTNIPQLAATSKPTRGTIRLDG